MWGSQRSNAWIRGRGISLCLKIFIHPDDVTGLVSNTEDRDLLFDTLCNYQVSAIAVINLNKSKALWAGILGCSFNLRGFTDHDKPSGVIDILGLAFSSDAVAELKLEKWFAS